LGYDRSKPRPFVSRLKYFVIYMVFIALIFGIPNVSYDEDGEQDDKVSDSNSLLQGSESSLFS